MHTNTTNEVCRRKQSLTEGVILSGCPDSGRDYERMWLWRSLPAEVPKVQGAIPALISQAKGQSVRNDHQVSLAVGCPPVGGLCLFCLDLQGRNAAFAFRLCFCPGLRLYD